MREVIMNGLVKMPGWKYTLNASDISDVIAYVRTLPEPPPPTTKAPGGANYMNDAGMVPRGKVVFAERCARCHSTILPPKVYADFFKPGCIGPNYLKCWNDY